MEQERELLRIGGKRGSATLSILCGPLEEGAAMTIACGDFVLFAVTRNEASLGLVACSVNEHRWILAVDCAAIRVGPRKFAFAFPEFFYCLSLPDGCFDHEVDRFEQALEGFSCYRNYAGLRDSDFVPRIAGVEFWVMAYSKIFTLSFQLIPQVIPRCPISAALDFSRKYHTATIIVLSILKRIPLPFAFIALPFPYSSISSVLFPSISAVADVVQVMGVDGGARLSQERRRGSGFFAAGSSFCWYMSGVGLARILHSAAWGRSAGGGGGVGEFAEVGRSEERGLPSCPLGMLG